MNKFGEMLSRAREAKKITLARASRDLVIKREQLQALEEEAWGKLPEPTFVKGYIRKYAEYLGLDFQHALAIYRREFDEAKYPQKTMSLEKKKRLMLTPNRILTFVFLLFVTIFVIYLLKTYFSILSAPKLEIFTPGDDLTTSISVIEVMGVTDKEATVSVDGEFIPVDGDGNFNYQYQLEDGRNVIEIVAAKRLSPKTRIAKIVRLAK